MGHERSCERKPSLSGGSYTGEITGVTFEPSARSVYFLLGSQTLIDGY